MTDNQKYFFLIALLAHLLFLLSFSLVFKSQLQLEQEQLYQPYYANLPKKDFSVLPAYFSPPVKQSSQPVTEPAPVTPKNLPTSKNGIEKPTRQQTTPANTPSTPLRYTAGSGNLASTAKKTYDDELLKILHEATGRKLVYPRMARDFRVTGTVQIRFLISPNGQVSRVKIIKSSGFGPFDNAAFTAISNLSPVRNVDLYLKQPKYVTAVLVFS